jgi:hypothetical protein
MARTRLDLGLVTAARWDDGLPSTPRWGFFYPPRIGMYWTLIHFNPWLAKHKFGPQRDRAPIVDLITRGTCIGPQYLLLPPSPNEALSVFVSSLTKLTSTKNSYEA